MVGEGINSFNYVKLYDRTFNQTAGEDKTTNLPSTIFNYSDVIIYIKNVHYASMTGRLELLLGEENIEVAYVNSSADIFLVLHLRFIKDVAVLFRPREGQVIASNALTNDYVDAFYQIFRKSVMQRQGIKYRSISTNSSFQSTITVTVYGSNQTML